MADTPAKPFRRDGANLSETKVNQDVSNRQLLESFIASRDDSAFAGLVQRYGGTVWRVCRRLLRQEQDAEDAFQSVFLILSRNAASIRNREGVGSWLYGVAYKTAMKARQAVWRRQNALPAARPAAPEPAASDTAALSELQRILDEEVLGLPVKYRAPFILCCLEGMSKSEAAQELDCKEGTVSGRLARARVLLQKRLLRRGVSLSAALTAFALTQQTIAAAMPALLLQTTAHAVLASQGGAAGSALSPAVLALAESYRSPARLIKAMPAVAFCLLLLLLVGALGVAIFHLVDDGGSGPTLVMIEPDTFLTPAVAMGTPVGEQVMGLAFSPDGQRLVTGGTLNTMPGQLKFWDVTTGKELRSLNRIAGVRAVAFAPDAEDLVTGDCQGNITLRDPVTGQERESAPAHAGRVNSVAYSPDSKFLVSGGSDRKVKLWSTRGLRELKVLGELADSVTAVAYFNHGRAVLTGSKDGSAKVWDLGSAKEKFALVGHKAGVESVAVSMDDKYVATASSDHTVRLWDAVTGKETAVFEGAPDNIFFAVAFSADAKMLAGAGSDGTIRLWDVRTKQAAGTLEKHAGTIFTLAFSRSGVLASGSSDRTAKLWGLGGPKELATLATSWSAQRPVLALAYAPDGKVLAVATKDHAVHIRDAVSGDVLMVLPGHTQEPISLAFSPDGRLLASGSRDNTIKIWDRATGQELRTLTGHTRAINALAFSPDGSKLASAGPDKIIRLWDPATGNPLDVFEGHEGTVIALAFAPGGQNLASAGADRTIKLWDLAKKTEIMTLRGHTGAVRALTYASDGTLASAAEDATVKLWDTSKGTERFTLAGHVGAVSALVFSPQGRTLVSAGQDRTVRVWDPSTGQSRGILMGHIGAVTALALHPYGHNLVSGSLDTLLLRWQAAKYPPKPIAADAKNKDEPISKNTPAIKGPGRTQNAEQEVARKENAKHEPKIKATQQVIQSFKGHTTPIPGWELNGPDAETYVKYEPEGLRIILPTGNPGPTPSIGIKTLTSVKGDFEITLSYEILKEPEPTEAGKDQTRFTLDVVLGGTQNDAATLSRRVSSWGGSQFYAWHRKWDEASGNKKQQGKEIAAQAKSGRLRITRAGAEVFYFVSEGAEEDFRFLAKYPFSLEDINTFRIVAITGGPKAELDVRFTEATIRAEYIPGAQQAFGTDPEKQSGAAAEAPKGKLAMVLLIGLVITILLAVALYVGLRARKPRGTEETAAPSHDASKEGSPAEPAPTLVFACSECGKKLKVKTELAGKKVKCPGCGHALLVPVSSN